MDKTFIKIVLLICLITSFSFAGVSGKIAGIAVDSKNGESLPGVNIVIEGTFMGASTDENGFYAILNVPPGVYKVQALYVGYKTVEVSQVKISADLTTNIDFSMMETTLEISETINVVADRPMIKRDEVSTRHYVTSEEIELQPIDSFQEIAKNQAGVVGNHFRGGRTGEVMVVIDGIPVRDQAGEYSGNLGGFTADIPEYAIEEMDVTLGGFSAEYGNVQSGILNLALKEGTRSLSGRFRIIHNPEFGSSKSFTENDFTFNQLQPIITTYELNLNGPLFLKNLSFSLSGEITNKDQGFYMNQESFDQSVQGKFTYKFSPQHKLTLGGLYNKSEWEQFYFPASKYGPGPNYQTDVYEAGVPQNSDTLFMYRYVDNKDLYGKTIFENQTDTTASGDPYNVVATRYSAGMQEYLWNRTQSSNMLYLIWSHTLNNKSFYEVRLNNFYSNYHYATPDVDDRDGDGDRDEDLQWDVSKQGSHPIYREQEENYWWVLGDDPGFRDQSSWTHSLKADYVNQFNSNNLFKAGLQFDYHRTEVENISWTLGVGIYRKDIWDEDSFDLSAYFQDKLEFESIVVLAGLRFDVFNPNGISDALYYPNDYNFPFSELDENGIPIITDPKKAELKYQFSPRIGISHPITSESILHFNYGHYFQRPDAYFLYRNYRIQSITKVGNYVGFPNLEPEKTVAYELAVEQQIASDYKVTVTGYYKDVTNLMNWEKYIGRSIQGNELNVYTNADYGNIKGMELTFSKRIGRYWGGTLNYTYSIAKGRSSDASGGSGSFTSAKKLNLLDYDQSHTINANLTFRTPEEFGTYFGGFYPFADWTTNIQFDFGSGLPYSTYGTNKVNDQRLPWTSTTDLRIMRSFKLFDVGVDAFADIYNIFDKHNTLYINAQYYDRQEPDINGDPSVTRQESEGSYVRNPQAYSSGRRIRFGIGIHF